MYTRAIDTTPDEFHEKQRTSDHVYASLGGRAVKYYMLFPSLSNYVTLEWLLTIV